MDVALTFVVLNDFILAIKCVNCCWVIPTHWQEACLLNVNNKDSMFIQSVDKL